MTTKKKSLDFRNIKPMQDELKLLKETNVEFKNLLRECVMRAHFAMPENKQDEKWFDDPKMSVDFIIQVYELLGLGQNKAFLDENKTADIDG